MNNDITLASAPAIRTLPPVSAPAAVADSGLVRIGAAVGCPAKR